MNAKEFNSLLLRMTACAPAVEWAQGKTLSIAWRTCTRGDWLLWLAIHGGKSQPVRAKLSRIINITGHLYDASFAEGASPAHVDDCLHQMAIQIRREITSKMMNAALSNPDSL